MTIEHNSWPVLKANEIFFILRPNGTEVPVLLTRNFFGLPGQPGKLCHYWVLSTLNGEVLGDVAPAETCICSKDTFSEIVSNFFSKYTKTLYIMKDNTGYEIDLSQFINEF